MSLGHALGAKLRAPEHHQGVKLSRPGLSASLPRSVDQRRAFNEIYQQGAMGSCVPTSGRRALRRRMLAQGAGDWVPAVLPPYQACLKRDGNYPNDEGTFPETFLSVVSEDGFGPEELAPYTDNVEALKRRVPDEYVRRAAKAKLTGWEPLDYDRDTIRFELAAGHPIMLCMLLHESFESVPISGQQAGRVPVPRSSEAELGGHEMDVCGYDEDWVIVANSWDRGFGDDGYGYVPWRMILDRYTTRGLHAIRTVQIIP